MNVTTVLLNLAGLAPLSVVALLMALPRRSGRAVPSAFWWALFVITSVPLGGFLAAIVAIAWGEPLQMAAFSWVDRPGHALGVLSACGMTGGFWTLGLATVVRSIFNPRDAAGHESIEAA